LLPNSVTRGGIDQSGAGRNAEILQTIQYSVEQSRA
jgi:hypothetical protein